jgi:hypothetical protein
MQLPMSIRFFLRLRLDFRPVDDTVCFARSLVPEGVSRGAIAYRSTQTFQEDFIQ